MDSSADHAAGGHRGRHEPRHAAPRRRSGELSGLVLEVLGQAGRPLTAGEVAELLEDTGVGPLAYTTVVTILSRLHVHGLADRSRVGRAYAYRAVADGAQLAARRMRRVLDAEDDRAAVLARFVGGLNARDEKVLRRLLGPDLTSGSQARDDPRDEAE